MWGFGSPSILVVVVVVAGRRCVDTFQHGTNKWKCSWIKCAIYRVVGVLWTKCGLNPTQPILLWTGEPDLCGRTVVTCWVDYDDVNVLVNYFGCKSEARRQTLNFSGPSLFPTLLQI